MHSDKFPKSTFSGKVTNLSSINFSKDGTYPATVSGKLTIHGVTKDVTEKGEIVVKGNSATLKSKFNVALADYDIKNDKLQNISNTIEVTVNTTLSK
jgi:polyisoprenoid-binding protein YceI